MLRRTLLILFAIATPARPAPLSGGQDEEEVVVRSSISFPAAGRTADGKKLTPPEAVRHIMSCRIIDLKKIIVRLRSQKDFPSHSLCELYICIL